MDFGLWTLDFGLWTLDFGTLDFGLWTLDFGTLDFGLWILDFGLLDFLGPASLTSLLHVPRLSFAWIIALSILTLARIFAAVPAAGPGRFPRERPGQGGGWRVGRRKTEGAGLLPSSAFRFEYSGKNHAAL